MKTNTPVALPAPSGRSHQNQAQPPRRTRITNQLRQQVIDHYTAGNVSAKAVAEELGIGKATVLNILKQSGAAVRPHGRRLT